MEGKAVPWDPKDHPALPTRVAVLETLMTEIKEDIRGMTELVRRAGLAGWIIASELALMILAAVVYAVLR